MYKYRCGDSPTRGKLHKFYKLSINNPSPLWLLRARGVYLHVLQGVSKVCIQVTLLVPASFGVSDEVPWGRPRVRMS